MRLAEEGPVKDICFRKWDLKNEKCDIFRTFPILIFFRKRNVLNQQTVISRISIR